jgi:hypothetical protein
MALDDLGAAYGEDGSIAPLADAGVCWCGSWIERVAGEFAQFAVGDAIGGFVP